MTENELVFRILETVRKEKVSDDRIDVRVIRAFLRNYRASKLKTYSNDGVTVDDEVFQYLGEITFKNPKNPIREKRKEFTSNDIPTIIRLKENFGIYFIKNGVNIPVQNSESYDLDFHDPYNKNLPRVKAQNHKYTLYIGDFHFMNPNSDTYQVVSGMYQEFISSNKSYDINVPCWAVLNNPDDCPGYNWKVHPYPFPNEMIDQLINSILTREFNIYLQTEPDSIGNGREDKIKFSDENGYEGQR